MSRRREYCSVDMSKGDELNIMKNSIVCMFGSNQKILEDNVSEQRVFDIKKKIKVLFEFMNEIDNYTMMIGNSTDFLNYTENGVEKMEEFENLNRLFMNWLNTFYVWIEYHERYHKELFGKFKGTFYDKYSEYRITYYLRRYTTHQSCCISKTTLALDIGKVTYLIPVEKMLAEGDMNKQTKSDLREIKNRDENIDARQLVEKTMQIMREFQNVLWKEEWKVVKAALDDLRKYIITEGFILRPTYIVSDDDKVRPFCISNTVGYLIQKMNQYKDLIDLLHS